MVEVSSGRTDAKIPIHVWRPSLIRRDFYIPTRRRLEIVIGASRAFRVVMGRLKILVAKVRLCSLLRRKVGGRNLTPGSPAPCIPKPRRSDRPATQQQR